MAPWAESVPRLTASKLLCGVLLASTLAIAEMEKVYEVDDRFPGWKGEVADVKLHNTEHPGAAKRSGAARDWGFGSLRETWRGEVDALSWEPRIFTYKGFLSQAECHALLELAADSQETLELHDSMDELVRTVSSRIGEVSFFRRGSMENLRLHLVKPGHSTDPMLSHLPEPNQGPRIIATFLIKLSAHTSAGGEVVFPRAPAPAEGVAGLSSCAAGKLATAMVQGDALLVYDVHPDNKNDLRAGFEVCAVPDTETVWATQVLLPVKGKTDEHLAVTEH